MNDTYIDNDTEYSSYGVGLSFYEDKTVGEGSTTVKILLTGFLGIFMVFSLIGNICTCAVIARDKNMRTPTNCYLLNLAITDLMIALFVPIEIYLIWEPDFYPLDEEGCRLHFLLWDLLSNCSVLTILAFTIERYLVISKPFLRQTLVLNSRVFKIVSVNWAVACLFAIPNAFYVYLVERKQNVYCFFTVPDTEKTYLVCMELLVFYVLPMTVIFVLYVLIAMKLRSTKSTSRQNPVHGKQKRNKAVKLLVAVAASFFICWSPYSALRLMIVLPGLSYDHYFNLWRVVIYLSSINIYMSTAVNPILYSLMSHKFRNAFRDLLKRGPSRSQATASHTRRSEC
ncbi:neuromedin-U receptor 2-like [Aricia agestis]|uniref:neuromedin-U receptor 2-like n=1 Tax=Aricia agestis TaxID=91739 RepID=UPI001C209496|nr:neuromedin-U receptor 2-like [Aricia agestis]